MTLFGHRIAELDYLGTNQIFRLWLRHETQWSAWILATGEPIIPTPELLAKWSSKTREGILNSLAWHEQSLLRAKVKSLSPKLEKLADRFVQQPITQSLDDVDFEFLACLRSDVDRQIFEDALRGKRVLPSTPRYGCGYMGAGESLYSFSLRDENRKRADRFLALWDRRFGLDQDSFTKSFYLSGLSGMIRLPVPVLSNPGVIHLYLIPVGFEQTSDVHQFEILTCHLPDPDPSLPDLIDKIKFNVETALPATYYLKAIWDKRPPYKDDNQPGPGDYESELVGPVQLSPGVETRNLIIDCSRRAKGGDAYYRADATALKQWHQNDSLSPDTFAGRGWNRAAPSFFTQRADRWIIRTNHAEGTIPVARLALAYEDSFHVQQTSGVPGLKIFLWRESQPWENRTTWRIVDDHNCTFEPIEHAADIAPFFKSFPRKSTSFRLVGYRVNSPNQIRFDLTLTNLVQTNLPSLSVDSMPIRKRFDDLEVKITSLTAENHAPRITAEFLENGQPSAGWSFLSADFIAADGNSVTGNNVCREEAALQVEAVAIRDFERAPIKIDVFVPEKIPLNTFIPLSISTNLFGETCHILGICGAGATSFKAVDLRGEGAIFGGGVQISYKNSHLNVQTSFPRLVIQVPENAKTFHFYVAAEKGALALEDTDYRIRDYRFYFIEVGPSLNLQFRASRKVPIKFTAKIPDGL